MTTLRTHFTFRVDTWTPDGESKSLKCRWRWSHPTSWGLVSFCDSLSAAEQH
jgi:hypothetical protein